MTETIEQKLALGPMSGLRKSAPTAAAPGANDVGPLLCATRMRLGKDLQDIARLLHIRYNYLVAIEDGRFEDLPGQAYAIGFVRAYAEHLGLDGDEIVRRFKDENAGVKKPASFNFPLPAPDSGVPSGVLLVVAVVMGMMVYGAWYSIAGADRRAADLIQEIPDRLAALLDRPSSAEPEPTPSDLAVLGTSEVTTPNAEVQEAASDEGVMEAPPELSAPTPAESIIADTSRTANEQANLVSAVAEQAAPPGKNVVPPVQIASVPSTPVVEEQPKPEPTKIDAAIVAPAKVEPTKPEPVKVDPIKVEPAKPEPAKAKPIKAEPALAEAPKSETAKIETAKTETSKVEPPKPEAPKSETLRAELVKAEPPNADPPKAEPPNADPAKADPLKAEPAKAEPAQIASVSPSAAVPKPSSKSNDVIELKATSDSWIQVRAGDQLLLTRLLRKGEVYRVPDRSGLTLMTGNAGGIEVSVNGAAMPPLGSEGTVARGVPLEAARLKTMAKAAMPAESDDSEPD